MPDPAAWSTQSVTLKMILHAAAVNFALTVIIGLHDEWHPLGPVSAFP